MTETNLKTMNKILEDFLVWKEEHDDDYQLDYIKNFLNTYYRGELLAFMDWVEDLYVQSAKDEDSSNLKNG